MMPDYSWTNIWSHLQNPSPGDLGNAFFEFGASIAIWLGVWKLYKDKMLRGWSAWSATFFATWGFYNTFYYPSLNQWYSFLAGLSVVTANCVWLSLVAYYARKESEKLHIGATGAIQWREEHYDAVNSQAVAKVRVKGRNVEYGETDDNIS